MTYFAHPHLRDMTKQVCAYRRAVNPGHQFSGARQRIRLGEEKGEGRFSPFASPRKKERRLAEQIGLTLANIRWAPIEYGNVTSAAG